MRFKIYLITLIASSISVGCSTNSTTQEVKDEVVEQLTEEELREQLREKECNNPNDYLTGNLGWEGKFKHALSLKINKLALNCTISNSATMATYKDLKCHVKFLSKTGSTVLEEEFIIYEFLAPNSSTVYKTIINISNQQYKDIYDTEWSIVSALCN